MSEPDPLQRVNENPLYRTLGLRLTEFESGRAVSELLPPAALCWPFEGQPHGGIVFTQIDTTVAIAMLRDLSGDNSCATVSVEIQFTRRARHAPFICRAWTTHRAKRIAFGRAETVDADGHLVAMAQATGRLIERRDSSHSV